MVTESAISTLQTKLNFTRVRVILWGALSFPYTTNGTEYEYTVGVVYLHPNSVNGLGGSVWIVYLRSGQFDVSVLFDNSTETIRRIDYPKIITIESSELTFSFVTSLVFVSLELVIAGLMLLDFSTHARSYTEQRYSKTDP